ncbi:MAG: GNAT family N-acetyltransferase [Spirochaetales bacterium]|nr:GNAT family N-acetyltransferase [Spirochaetales bacterium]
MTYYDVLEPERCGGRDFDFLLARGWYPMRQTIFTTSHLFGLEDQPARRVHWLRYPVEKIAEKASHRRILRKNEQFETVLFDPFVHSEELDQLYSVYYDSIEFDGYPSVSRATYDREEGNIYDTKAWVVRDEGRAVACGIFHVGQLSLASILHFFDPEYGRYSPGKYLILKTLEYARARGMNWYYPGYIIEGDHKMDYKLFLGRDTVQYYDPRPHPLNGSWRSRPGN